MVKLWKKQGYLVIMCLHQDVPVIVRIEDPETGEAGQTESARKRQAQIVNLLALAISGF